MFYGHLHCEAAGMRTLCRVALVAGLVLTARVSSADPIQVGDLIKFTGTTGTLGGGAFQVDNLSNGAGVDFETFCVQMTQYLDFSNTFRVDSISNYADDASGHDPLSTATQWIFSSYRAGLLGGYNVDEIQAAIWKLEGEWNTTIGNSQSLINAAYAGVAQGWVNDGSVKVLNLFYYPSNVPAQDQIVQMSVAALLPPPTGTPEPATLALVGLGGLMAAGRKRLKARLGRQNEAIG
jgi:PEP-CTERM motif